MTLERDQLDLIADKIEEGCLNASVADSLDPCWRKQLLEPPRVKLTGTAVGATAITYGLAQGWLTLLRENGELKIAFWAPELSLTGHNIARETIHAIKAAVKDVIPETRIQIRGAKPFEWLALKGMPAEDIKKLPR